MEQQRVPNSDDDQKVTYGFDQTPPYNYNPKPSQDSNQNPSQEHEQKGAYMYEQKPLGSLSQPRGNDYPLDVEELAQTLNVIDKIRASLLQRSESGSSRSATRTVRGSTRPESDTVPGLPHPVPLVYSPGFHSSKQQPPYYVEGGQRNNDPPMTKHISFNDREIHFPSENALPPREHRQSMWRKSLRALDPNNPNRRTNAVFFGPGGPATQLDVEQEPSESLDWNGKGSDPITKREYLYSLAKSLMLYGAPGHRLELYLGMTAKALRSDVDFTYLPDSLTMYIDDPVNHTGHTRLIKGAGTDLGRWLEAHNVSKHVINDSITVEDGIRELRDISEKPPLHSDWFLFFIYGLAGIGIAPFAYGARFVDLPICFILSVMLGVMQVKLAPRNHLYSVLFEVSAAILFSFIGRLIGSIRTVDGQRVFCYGAISEAAINLIQPGYWITNACLELMNRQITTSGARITYAVVYALLLAYGVAVGSSLYGLIDHDAVATTVCERQISPYWNLFFVPFFSIQVAILGGAKYRQIPIMVFIVFAMYCASFFGSMLTRGSFTVGATAGGFVIGVLGNAYARMGRRFEMAFIDKIFGEAPGANTVKGSIGYTCAAAAMVPAMIVVVPSGLANRGSHLAGILAAEEMVKNQTGVPAFPAVHSEVFYAAFPIYLNVIQAGLSIAVGLSIGALAVYPFGKSRSWVMSW